MEIAANAGQTNLFSGRFSISFLREARRSNGDTIEAKTHADLRLAGRPADYQKLGIDPVEVAQFEDGQRIGTEKGRYEWWYFDVHLDNGATVVVVFWTKPNVSPNRPPHRGSPSI